MRCDCRRAKGGVGGAFLRNDADGDGGSGAFPADSLSNMLSCSASCTGYVGAGGRGLLRSVCERFEAGLAVKKCWELLELELGVGGCGELRGTDRLGEG